MGIIADQIDKHWQERQSRNKGHRLHLGASKLGHSCKRKLWYDFRWCSDEILEGRKYRLFQRGHNEEAYFVKQLLWLGAEIITVNQRTHTQYTYSHFGGHVGGSLDGVARGLPVKPMLWTLLEFKTHDKASFNQLVKHGVKKSKPEHFSQVQMYMGWAGLERALYLAVNKNDDTIYDEFIEFDKLEYGRLMERAEDIVFAPTPIERVSDSPKYYECLYCDHRFICHESIIDPTTNAQVKTAAINCRTCLHSTPLKEGGWNCEHNNRNVKLDEQRQRRGCRHHRFIPELVPFATVVDANAVLNEVTYQIKPSMQSCPPKSSVLPEAVFFRNGEKGKNSYESRELQYVTINQIGDAFIEDVRAKLGGYFFKDDAIEPLMELDNELDDSKLSVKGEYSHGR